jgi:hypothetical protein
MEQLVLLTSAILIMVLYVQVELVPLVQTLMVLLSAIAHHHNTGLGRHALLKALGEAVVRLEAIVNVYKVVFYALLKHFSVYFLFIKFL